MFVAHLLCGNEFFPNMIFFKIPHEDEIYSLFFIDEAKVTRLESGGVQIQAQICFFGSTKLRLPSPLGISAFNGRIPSGRIYPQKASDSVWEDEEYPWVWGRNQILQELETFSQHPEAQPSHPTPPREEWGSTRCFRKGDEQLSLDVLILSFWIVFLGPNFVFNLYQIRWVDSGQIWMGWRWEVRYAWERFEEGSKLTASVSCLLMP